MVQGHVSFASFPSMGIKDFEHMGSVLLSIFYANLDQAYECRWIFVLTSKAELELAWLTEGSQ